MSYHLFLDDARQPKDVKWIELPPYSWVVVKTYKEFVDTITKMGMPTTVTFDHDLAEEHYQEYSRAHDPRLLPANKRIRYEIFAEKTGYDCAKWLANYCVDNNIPLPLYYVHTLNPIGKANIFSVMESARGFLAKFTILDTTPEEKEAWRDRMRKRGLIQ